MTARPTLIAAVVCAQFVAACAARLPVVSTPVYPSYPYPVVPAELAGTRAATDHELAWQFLQAGDLDAAEDGFAAALRRRPSFHPSTTGLGFVALAQDHANEAVQRFDRALTQTPAYVPALLGRAEALLVGDRVDEAVESLAAAVSADPSLTALRQRIAELEFTGLMAQVTLARGASEAGRNVEARAAYERVIAASPESGFLYVELAEVERRLGDTGAAIGRLERAVALDPNAIAAWVSMSDIYLSQGHLDRAEQALLRAVAIEPRPDIAKRLADLEAGRRQATFPPEYREIEAAEAITRGQLAALIGVRFEWLLADRTSGRAAIITDTRDHWAYGWVIAVAQAGLMQADVNYRFQPERIVTRVELARVMVRMLRLAGVEPVSPMARPSFSDLATGHLGYPAASEVVTAGLLQPLDQGTFQPGRAVGGAAAAAALGRVGKLVPVDR